MKALIESRIKKLSDEISKEGCDGYIATRAHNIFYFTGFWGSGYFLLKGERAKLLTSVLELDRAARSSSVPVEKISKSIAEEIGSFFGQSKVCIDESFASTYIQLSEKISLKRSLAAERLREVKDSEEKSALAEGGKIMDLVFEKALVKIKENISERELYSEIVKEIISLGADVIPYEDTIGTEIVAFGPNTAYPHYSPPGDYKLKPGDPILLDLTLRFKGHIVDFTRTVFYKSASEKQKEVYYKVKEAQELGIKMLKPGVKAKDLDLAVREFFKEEKDRFVHSLGHGIGLEVHELPYISSRSEDAIKEGSAVTIEPGLYYPGFLGVRIEDSLIVESEPKNLFKATKDLLIV